jgi:hypothetical protein
MSPFQAVVHRVVNLIIHFCLIPYSGNFRGGSNFCGLISQMHTIMPIIRYNCAYSMGLVFMGEISRKNSINFHTRIATKDDHSV